MCIGMLLSFSFTDGSELSDSELSDGEKGMDSCYTFSAATRPGAGGVLWVGLGIGVGEAVPVLGDEVADAGQEGGSGAGRLHQIVHNVRHVQQAVPRDALLLRPPA